MKGFKRENKAPLSLCGLNCGLCTMYLGKYCPGCGGGEGNQQYSTPGCCRLNLPITYGQLPSPPPQPGQYLPRYTAESSGLKPAQGQQPVLTF